MARSPLVGVAWSNLCFMLATGPPVPQKCHNDHRKSPVWATGRTQNVPHLENPDDGLPHADLLQFDGARRLPAYRGQAGRGVGGYRPSMKWNVAI